MPELVTITPEAIEFFKKSLAYNKNYKGVRVDIISGGCQGMTYKIDFTAEIDPADLCQEKDGLKFYFSPKSVLFASGMTVDYKTSPMGGSIVFENPNATAKCSCGKSFCVEADGACNSGSCSSHSC